MARPEVSEARDKAELAGALRQRPHHRAKLFGFPTFRQENTAQPKRFGLLCLGQTRTGIGCTAGQDIGMQPGRHQAGHVDSPISLSARVVRRQLPSPISGSFKFTDR